MSFVKKIGTDLYQWTDIATDNPEEELLRKLKGERDFYYVLDSGVECADCGCRIFCFVVHKPGSIMCARCKTPSPMENRNEWEARVREIMGKPREISRLFKEFHG